MKTIHTPGNPLRFEPEPPGINTTLTTMSDPVNQETMLETKDIKKSRYILAYVVLPTRQVKRSRVVNLEGDIFASWPRSSGSYGWTQFRALPYGSRVFKDRQEAHKFIAPGPRVKMWVVPWHGTDITEVEKAPDGTLWANGERYRQAGEEFNTLAKAKRYALKQLKSIAHDEAKTLKKTRAKIRELEKK